jgi:hypothetical protein
MVTLEVKALLAGGKALDLRARADTPERQADGSWICRVEVAPLNAQPLDVRGVDSFHAMWLACSLILKILTQLEENGARLVNHDGSDFPLEAYLAGLDEKR